MSQTQIHDGRQKNPGKRGISFYRVVTAIFISSAVASLGAPARGETNGKELTPPTAKDHGTNQWTNNGNDIYYDDGKVGIGTATPEWPLHVVGNIKLDYEADPNRTLLVGYNPNFDFFFLSPWDFGNNRGINLILGGTGYFGIGTAPSQQLTITECLRFDEADVDLCNDDAQYASTGVTLRAISNPVAGQPIFRVLSALGSERLKVEHDGRLYTTNRLYVASGGNSYIGGKLGVGTASPSETLQVEGNIKLSGNLVSDGDICIGSCN